MIEGKLQPLDHKFLLQTAASHREIEPHAPLENGEHPARQGHPRTARQRRDGEISNIFSSDCFLVEIQVQASHQPLENSDGQ